MNGTEEKEVLAFDATKPHSVNSADNKISTFDQNGHLYDGLTLLPLESMDKEKYCVPEGAPFSKIKGTNEKITEAISTIRASGAIDPDTLAKFDKMFRNLLQEGGEKEQSSGGGGEERRPFRKRLGETSQETS